MKTTGNIAIINWNFKNIEVVGYAYAGMNFEAKEDCPIPRL
jgi:hypothetical protein